MALEHKILTWDCLQKKGWEGPNLCVLCKNHTEDPNHLFIDCLFTKRTWKIIFFTFKIKGKWVGKDLAYCFYQCVKDKYVSPSLAAITCWFIWLERNIATFENLQPSIHSVIIKVRGLYKPQLQSQVHFPIKECLIQYSDGSLIAFFDGTTQSDKSSCGARGVINTVDSQVYRWHLNCGEGTNTKA